MTPLLTCAMQLTCRRIESVIRFRSRDDARFRPGLPLGKRGSGICRSDRRTGGLRGAARERFERSRWRAVFARKRDARAPGIVARYFALDHPLAEICASFPDDPTMQAARDYCRGLRIIRQPLWECLATFITSSMKQVAHIRQISSRAAQAVWDRHQHMRDVTYMPSHPRSDWRGLTEKELRECGAGLSRKKSSRNGPARRYREADLESWRALPDDELRAQLLRAAGRRREGGELRDALRLRAVTRFPDRRLDRACLAARNIFRAGRKVTARQLREFRGEAISARTAAMRSSIFFTTRARQLRAGCHPAQGEIILRLKKLAHRPTTRFRVVAQFPGRDTHDGPKTRSAQSVVGRARFRRRALPDRPFAGRFRRRSAGYRSRGATGPATDHRAAARADTAAGRAKKRPDDNGRPDPANPPSLRKRKPSRRTKTPSRRRKRPRRRTTNCPARMERIAPS